MNKPRTLVAVWSLVFCLMALPVAAQQKSASKKPTKVPVLVGLVCTWSAYAVNKETLLIDLRNKTAYWVNENQNLKVLQFNPGRIVLAGVRGVLQTSRSQAEKKVPMQMTINRISGEFDVRQQAISSQGPGSCRKQRLF